VGCSSKDIEEFNMSSEHKQLRSERYWGA